jgi:cytochrome c-type biogenesis protein CcmH/NrfG
VLLALSVFIAGIGVGALTRSEAPVPVAGVAAAAMPPSASPAPPAAQPFTPETLNAVAGPLLAAIKANPRDTGALTELGNLYYDRKQYKEAIEYYRRAADGDPKNPDLLTDLGTALWYSGSAEKAIAEYNKALALRPDYPATLMNLGIVRMDGLQDYPGAITAWKKLLQANPAFAQRDKVAGLIAQAENKLK